MIFLRNLGDKPRATANLDAQACEASGRAHLLGVVRALLLEDLGLLVRNLLVNLGSLARLVAVHSGLHDSLAADLERLGGTAASTYGSCGVLLGELGLLALLLGLVLPLGFPLKLVGD